MNTRMAAEHERPSPYEPLMLAGGIVAGACFIASMALFVGLVAPDMPPMDALPAVKASFYATQAASPIYTWTRLLIFAQLAPLAMLFGGLYAVLRRAEGGSGALASAVFAAGLFAALLSPLSELVEGHMLLGLAAAGADPLVVIGFDGMTPVALPLLFPDGRLPSPRWRPLAWVAACATLLLSFTLAISPGPLDASLPEVGNACICSLAVSGESTPAATSARI